MMTSVSKQLNSFLETLCDTNDDIYTSLIADKSAVPNSEVNHPIDFNDGTLADILEWNRQLAKSLVKQLYYDQSEGLFLDLYAFKFLGIIRLENENDDDYKKRVKNFTFGYKASPAMIINAVRSYSTQTPRITGADFDMAFADVCFADHYSETFLDNESNRYIVPAIAINTIKGEFFFILELYGTQSEDIIKVIDIVSRIKIAGVDYEIRLTEN